MIFYKEWLPLDKADFRILAMLADLGEFRGNLSDMCRYFSLSVQTSHRNQLKASIQKLKELNYIEANKSGQTYTLKLIPKETELTIPDEWYKRIKSHEYSSESVSWEVVIKVLLWLCENNDLLITNNEIAADLKISISTIGAAKNVLQKEYQAITRKPKYYKPRENSFRRKGHIVNVAAWWSDE